MTATTTDLLDIDDRPAIGWLPSGSLSACSPSALGHLLEAARLARPTDQGAPCTR